MDLKEEDVMSVIMFTLAGRMSSSSFLVSPVTRTLGSLWASLSSRMAPPVL